ncbi:hypothetical protein D3C59_36415, partial [Streptomyces sp. SHP22-7]
AAISDLEAVAEIATTNGKTIIMQAPKRPRVRSWKPSALRRGRSGSKNVKITIPTGTPISAVNAIQGAINGMHGKNIGIGIYKTEYLNTVRVGTAIDGKKYPGVTPQARAASSTSTPTAACGTPATGRTSTSQRSPGRVLPHLWRAGDRRGIVHTFVAFQASSVPAHRRGDRSPPRRGPRHHPVVRRRWPVGLAVRPGHRLSLLAVGRRQGRSQDEEGQGQGRRVLRPCRGGAKAVGPRKATAAWNRNLEKVAERAGTDVAQALASMGEDGLKIAAKMATGTNKYVASMSIALRGLEQTARASLKAFTTDLNHAFGNQSIFQQNLAQLAAQGFGDLAARLADQNDQAAYDLAAAAVSDKGKASKANTASRNAEKALTREQLSALVAIIAAISTKTTGIHDVAGKTGLGEDEIIEVANKAKAQITKSLGSRAARFLSDLGKANKGLAYADGGIRAGLYATSGGIIRFAEPSTRGEAYIPLSPSKRRTALPVLADVANRFGVGLTDAAAGRPVVIVKHGDSMQVTVTPVRTGRPPQTLPRRSAGRGAAHAGEGWPPVPLELADWQYDVGGVVIGADTIVNVLGTTGLGRPPVRESDVDQPSMDGQFAGPDYWAGRTIQIDAAVKTPGDPAAAQDMVAALQAVTDAADVRLVGGQGMVLRIKRPGRPVKRLTVRARRLDPEDEQIIHGYLPLDLEFLAHDPGFYADEESTTELPLGWLTGGGFAAPVVAPIYVQDGTVAADRPGWVTNNGTGAAWPILRVFGPCANVTITNVATGRSLALPTLNLPVGRWIEIDTRPGHRTVTWDNGGNASTYLSASSRIDLFSIPPGTSEMRWTAFDNTNSARLRVTWRDAYIAL